MFQQISRRVSDLAKILLFVPRPVDRQYVLYGIGDLQYFACERESCPGRAPRADVESCGFDLLRLELVSKLNQALAVANCSFGFNCGPVPTVDLSSAVAE